MQCRVTFVYYMGIFRSGAGRTGDEILAMMPDEHRPSSWFEAWWRVARLDVSWGQQCRCRNKRLEPQWLLDGCDDTSLPA